MLGARDSHAILRPPRKPPARRAWRAFADTPDLFDHLRARPPAA